MATSQSRSVDEMLQSQPAPVEKKPSRSVEEMLAYSEAYPAPQGRDALQAMGETALAMFDPKNPAPPRDKYFANMGIVNDLRRDGVLPPEPGVGEMLESAFVSAADGLNSLLWKYDPENEGVTTTRNLADLATGNLYSLSQGQRPTAVPGMATLDALRRAPATLAAAKAWTKDFYKTLARGLATSPKYRVKETGEFVYPGTMMPDAGVGDTTLELMQMYKQQGKTLNPVNEEDLKDLEYEQFLQKRNATGDLNAVMEADYRPEIVSNVLQSAAAGSYDTIFGTKYLQALDAAPVRPQEGQAMVLSMFADPGAIAAGAFAPARLGATAFLKGATAKTLELSAKSAGYAARILPQSDEGLKFVRGSKKMLAAIGTGYVAGELRDAEIITPEMDRGIKYASAGYGLFVAGAGVLRSSGNVLRGAEQRASKVAYILRESIGPGNTLDKAARAAVAANPDVPFRYKDPLVRPSAYTSKESTSSRLARDPNLSPKARKFFGVLADWRITQAARMSGAAVAGGTKGVIANLPFSEPLRAAGEPEMANLMLGMGVTIGAPVGAGARIAQTTKRRASAADSDIGRMLGEIQQFGEARPPKRAADPDAEVMRTMIESELAGGDVSAMVNNLSPDQLNEFAAVQGYFRDTVDFVPLGGDDYRANVNMLEGGGDPGPIFFDAPDGQRPRVFVNVEEAKNIRAGELGRAFLKSNSMPEMQKAAMINGVDTLYTPEQIAARERKLAKDHVNALFAKHGIEFGDNDPIVLNRVEANRNQWKKEFGQENGANAGLRQAIAAEDLANGVVDWNRMRRGLPLGANPISFMENVLGAQARGLQISGVRIDPETGRPLDTPESLKRNNPAAADDPSVVAATKNYTDGYNKMRRDPANETAVAEPVSPERVAQIELSMTDAPARARQIIDMAGGPDGPNLTATDPTFGWRQEGNRRILSGTRLPDRVRFANHWKPHFEMIDQVQTAMDGGGFVVMRWDTIGKSADVTKRDGPQYGAITREGIITRWKATTGKRSENYRTGGNLNVEIADYTTLRNNVLTVMEKKHSALDPARGGPGANLGAIMADVDLYLANRRSGVDLGTNMTPERLRIAEALTMGRRGNVFEGTIPRDGIFREARIELVETIQPTGRQGHNMVPNNPDGSVTAPPAKPMPDMGSDVVPRE